MYVGDNIFELDRLIIPVNVSKTHWFVVCVLLQHAQIVVYDSMPVKGGRMNYLKIVEKYIQSEYAQYNGVDLPYPLEFNLIPCCPGNETTPQQDDNLNNCGVYTAMFMELLVNKKDPSLLNGCQQSIEMNGRYALWQSILCNRPIFFDCYRPPQAGLKQLETESSHIIQNLFPLTWSGIDQTPSVITDGGFSKAEANEKVAKEIGQEDNRIKGTPLLNINFDKKFIADRFKILHSFEEQSKELTNTLNQLDNGEARKGPDLTMCLSFDNGEELLNRIDCDEIHKLSKPEQLITGSPIDYYRCLLIRDHLKEASVSKSDFKCSWIFSTTWMDLLVGTGEYNYNLVKLTDRKWIGKECNHHYSTFWSGDCSNLNTYLLSLSCFVLFH